MDLKKNLNIIVLKIFSQVFVRACVKFWTVIIDNFNNKKLKVFDYHVFIIRKL